MFGPPKITYHSDRATAVGVKQTNNSYLPNYPIEGQFIDPFHHHLAKCPSKNGLIELGIPGWLRHEDALKLYELGYFADGDILEFGTNRGLSTYILANAIKASGRARTVVTMELYQEFSLMARESLTERKCASWVEFLVGDADAACRKLAKNGRKFGFAFIDHSHAYEHMVRACQRLSALMERGSFCVFHDYNDARNSRRRGVGEDENEYGIQAAIEDALDPAEFEFVGIYGCAGAYRRK